MKEFSLSFLHFKGSFDLRLTCAQASLVYSQHSVGIFPVWHLYNSFSWVQWRMCTQVHTCTVDSRPGVNHSDTHTWPPTTLWVPCHCRRSSQRSKDKCLLRSLVGNFWKLRPFWNPHTVTSPRCSQSELHIDFQWTCLVRTWWRTEKAGCHNGHPGN